MKAWKKALRFALCLLPVGLAGGWFTAEMSLSGMDASLLETALEQAGSLEIMKAVTTAQSVLYAVVCGFFGYILAEKTGLMRPFRVQNPPLARVILVSAAGAALYSLDAWTFARWIPQLQASYETASTFDAGVWIASVLYGGVIEEVMIRLFLMSGLALIGWKLFFRKEAAVPNRVLIAANLLSALAFAAGHLPATAASLGGLTLLLVLRCFLMNGAAGLLFGRFYRKYGIQYAMLAHMLFHLISRAIWLIAL
ncbi:MAG: CPBP family intramembrane metalloprotease [Clostridia bacterium]|nr:CPBP family intramembrane metalloprotease [Clostridia bacterium]